jgi:hypothetical protein
MRPCGHNLSNTPIIDCRVCELWANNPEYYCLWEGLPSPEVPEIVQELRKTSFNLWVSPEKVQLIAKEYGKTPPDVAVPHGPSLLQKAVNFAGAVTHHIVTGSKIADPEEVDRRRKICISCPRFSASQSCNICGCAVIAKTMWLEQFCPDTPARW